MKYIGNSNLKVAYRGVISFLLAFVFSTANAIEPAELDGFWFKVNSTLKGICEDNAGDLVSDNDREVGYLLFSYTTDPTYQGTFIFPEEFGGWNWTDAEISLVMGTINSGVLRIELNDLSGFVTQAIHFARVTGTERNGVIKKIGIKTFAGFEYENEFVDETCVYTDKLMAKSIAWEQVPPEVVAVTQ